MQQSAKVNTKTGINNTYELASILTSKAVLICSQLFLRSSLILKADFRQKKMSFDMEVKIDS